MATGKKLAQTIHEYLESIIARRGAEILTGVPAEVYKERVAELRAYRNMRDELPNLMRKADDEH